MANQYDQAMSRRDFLKNAIKTAVAASATGAGAALYNQALPTTPVITSSSTTATAVSTPTNNITSNPEALTQLASAQAENVRLQTALEAAQTQLASL